MDFIDSDIAQFAKTYYDDLYAKDYETLLDEDSTSIFDMPANWENMRMFKSLLSSDMIIGKIIQKHPRKHSYKEKISYFLFLR